MTQYSRNFGHRIKVEETVTEEDGRMTQSGLSSNSLRLGLPSVR